MRKYIAFVSIVAGFMLMISAPLVLAGVNKFGETEIISKEGEVEGYGNTSMTLNTDGTLYLGNNDDAETMTGNITIFNGLAEGESANVNCDYTDFFAVNAIGGLAKTDGNIIVGDGTTWVAESGSTARTSLGLGTIATQNANNVAITGGSVSGITDLAIADGGTGASTAAAACSALGVGVEDDVSLHSLTIGQEGEVEIYLTDAGAIIADANIYSYGTVTGKMQLISGSNTETGGYAGSLLIKNGLYPGSTCEMDYGDCVLLDAIGELTPTDGNIIVGNGTTWVAESGATARTSLGLGSSSSPTFEAITADLYWLNGTSSCSYSGNPQILSTAIRESGSFADGDILWRLFVNAYDSPADDPAAAITAGIDGTPGDEDMPGFLDFYTTPDGSVAPIKRMRIGSSGILTLGSNGASPNGSAGAITWCDGANPGSTTAWTYADAEFLDTVAGLSKTDGNFVVTNGTTFVAESGATARTSLGVGTGDSPQFTGLTTTGDITAIKSGGFPVLYLNSYYNSDWGSRLVFVKGRGTSGTPTQTKNNDIQAAIYSYGYDNGTPAVARAGTLLRVYAEGDYTSTSVPSGYYFYTTASGSLTNTINFKIAGSGYILTPGVYAQTSASAANVVVDSSGNLMRSTSSARYKTDIATISGAGNVLSLAPKKFKSIKDEKRISINRYFELEKAQDYLKRASESGSASDVLKGEADLAAAQEELLKPVVMPEQYGLIAEEVAAVDPKLALYDKDGLPESVDYNAVVALLIDQVKTQALQIEDLEKRVKKLEEKQ